LFLLLQSCLVLCHLLGFGLSLFSFLFDLLKLLGFEFLSAALLLLPLTLHLLSKLLLTSLISRGRGEKILILLQVQKLKIQLTPCRYNILTPYYMYVGNLTM
jgi:hypothetical protein